jgi:GrpB-like predicted nucleotidyltransferase (UPF0157 family)
MEGSTMMKGSARAMTKSEDYLAKVTIGELKPIDSSIFLSPYNPDWPLSFSRLAQLINNALADKVLLLEHVGSTSVPGLSAKPIIDIVLAVSDSADETSYVPLLEAQGFVLRIREPEWVEHRMFKTPGTNGNLHVFTFGCKEIDRMLAFRNWLRTHEGDRLQYESVKRTLSARTWRHVQDYADAKSGVVEEILTRALASKK